MIRRTNGCLERYAKACADGTYLIGAELRMELDTLLRDMESEDYIYDTADAEKRISFMEGALRLTKSPFYGQKMVLLDFQKAFISALYGFKMPDGTDRFQKALFLMARKNGKSEMCSALVLTEMLIGGKGLGIVCSSNDDMQASILTDAVDTMRLMIDPKQDDTWRNQRGIRCKYNDNRIFKLSDRTRNKEGRNIDIAVIDEVHEMKDKVIVKSIEQSQSLKINPKLIIITTEGFVNGGYLDNELIRARGIVRGEVEDTASIRYLPWMYTQDSESEVWNGNEKNRLWMKSNPTVGIVKRYSYLEQQVDLARQSKADRSFVLAKDFNIKQSNSEAWLLLEDYNYERVFDLNEFRNAVYLGAVDLAETTDLSCAKILFMKPGSPEKYVYSMYFMPEGKLSRADDKSAGADYLEWAKNGMVKIFPGNYLDVTVVADWFASLYRDYGFRPLSVGYDVKFASEFLSKMDAYGFDTELIYQSAEVLNTATKMTEADLKSRLIVGNSVIDKWCLSNAALRVDSRGNGQVVKIDGQISRKIDGAVTLVMLMEMFRRHRTEFLNNV